MNYLYDNDDITWYVMSINVKKSIAIVLKVFLSIERICRKEYNENTYIILLKVVINSPRMIHVVFGNLDKGTGCLFWKLSMTEGHRLIVGE